MLSQAPAPGFDDPIALLLACHDKVRHFASLAPRIAQHLAEHGADLEAAQAATNVLRYFERAAPLHHADEEDDLFPALRQLGELELNHSLDTLQAEHALLNALWLAVRPWLDAVTRQQWLPSPAELGDFAQRYPAHADQEEALVYGAASKLSAETLQRLGAAMSQRRGGKAWA